MPTAGRSRGQPARPRGRWSLWIKTALGLAITAALVLFLFRYIDMDQLGRMLARTRWPLYLAGLGLWGAVYLVRTVRFVLIAPRTPYLTMLAIASVHNLLLRLLPMRTGDLSYAFLVRRAGTAGLGESLLGLLLLRALDATAVVALFCAFLGLSQGTYLGDRRLGILVAALAAAAGLALVFLLGRLLRLSLRAARRLAGALGVERRPGIERILASIERAIEAFSRIGPWTTLKLAGASMLLWLLTFGVFFVIMRAFSTPVGVAQTVLGSTAAVVTGFLPIGGIGSFGTLEAGWALGFVLVGLDRELAVATGFGVSIATFTYCALFGLLGWIGLTLLARRNNSLGETDG